MADDISSFITELPSVIMTTTEAPSMITEMVSSLSSSLSSVTDALIPPQSISRIDMLLVVLVGLIGALLSEGVAWFFVYRHNNYKQLQFEVNRGTLRLDKQKESAPKSLKRDAKLKLQEEQLAKKSQSLSWYRMKAGLFSTVLYFTIVPLFNRRFEGVVVANLPFEPILFFKSLAHHKLTTFKPTDCAAMYLYILSIGFFRTNVQMLTGTAPAKANKRGGAFGSFGAPQN